MPHHGLLQDLAIVLLVASLVTLLFQKLKLPSVLGYVVAGFLIGPHLFSAPIISNEGNIHTLSELGVIFLLFGMGLEFNLRKLRAVGAAAAIAGIIEIGGMMLIGNVAARLLGWTSLEGIFLGGIIAISSTTIILKVLTELNLKKEAFTDMVFGLLVIEDLFAVLLLAFLSGMSGGNLNMGTETLLSLGKMTIFLVMSLVFGLMLIPRFVSWVGSLKNEETLLVTVLALCLGFCALVLYMGYSVALGAFLMGSILAESRSFGRIEALIHPIRDLFCAVFFVSVGLMFDPTAVRDNIPTVAIICTIVVFGKSFLCSFGAFTAGRNLATSLRVGMSMAQIGEFSFVIAGIAALNGISFIYPLAVGVSVITTLLTPILIRNSDKTAGLFLKWLPNTIISYIDFYHRWTIQLGERSHNNAIQKILQRIILQLVVFVSIISGAFLLAIFLYQVIIEVFSTPEKWDPWIGSGLWLVALLSSIPLLFATFRKLKALGMLLAELGTPYSMGGKHTKEVRAILSTVFSLAGTGFLIFYGSLLSSAILPSGGLLGFIILGVALFVFFQRDAFNKIYFNGKAALEDTFDRPHIKEADGLMPTALPKESVVHNMMKKAKIIQLTLEDTSPLAKKLIRETALRTETGVSIIALERADEFIVNPGPDEELIPGDSILLMGLPAQISVAQSKFERAGSETTKIAKVTS